MNKNLPRLAILAAIILLVGAFMWWQSSDDSTTENTNVNEQQQESDEPQQQEDSEQTRDGDEQAEQENTNEDTESNEGTENDQGANDEQDQASQSESSYSYSAQAGDSFSKIARKAVQTYGINNQVSLSQAEIVAAETFLTLENNSPELSVGDEVVLNDASVDAAVKKAQGLSEEQKSLWQRYTAGVDFNTDSVGEAS